MRESLPTPPHSDLAGRLVLDVSTKVESKTDSRRNQNSSRNNNNTTHSSAHNRQHHSTITAAAAAVNKTPGLVTHSRPGSTSSP